MPRSAEGEVVYKLFGTLKDFADKTHKVDQARIIRYMSGDTNAIQEGMCAALVMKWLEEEITLRSKRVMRGDSTHQSNADVIRNAGIPQIFEIYKTIYADAQRMMYFGLNKMITGNPELLAANNEIIGKEPEDIPEFHVINLLIGQARLAAHKIARSELVKMCNLVEGSALEVPFGQTYNDYWKANDYGGTFSQHLRSYLRKTELLGEKIRTYISLDLNSGGKSNGHAIGMISEVKTAADGKTRQVTFFDPNCGVYKIKTGMEELFFEEYERCYSKWGFSALENIRSIVMVEKRPPAFGV